MAARNKPPLWKCPECGHKFVTRNLSHSCGRYRLEPHFRGRDPAVRRSFDKLCRMARACGPVTIYPQKTRIVIMARVRFSGGMTRKTYFQAGLWLKRRAEHPALMRVDDFGRIGMVHYFRIERPTQLDAAFAKLLGEAYVIGQQEHPDQTSRRHRGRQE